MINYVYRHVLSIESSENHFISTTPRQRLGPQINKSI